MDGSARCLARQSQGTVSSLTWWLNLEGRREGGINSAKKMIGKREGERNREKYTIKNGYFGRVKDLKKGKRKEI